MDDLRLLMASRAFVILDGAMGSELQRRGIYTGLPLWSAHSLLNAPDVVYQIHLDYLKAGADIITTNTFRTNPRTFLKAGRSEDDARRATFKAVELAKRARRDSGRGDVLIAGSVAPLEDCYSPDLSPDKDTAFKEHKLLINWLVEAGVDLLLLETFNSAREILAVSAAASESGKPFIPGVIIDKNLNLLSGESFSLTMEKTIHMNPFCLSVNCVHPRLISSVLKKYGSEFPELICGYANLGKSDYGDAEILDIYSPQEYLAYVKDYINYGLKIVGGCCGSRPEHIREIDLFRREILNQKA